MAMSSLALPALAHWMRAAVSLCSPASVKPLASVSPDPSWATASSLVRDMSTVNPSAWSRRDGLDGPRMQLPPAEEADEDQQHNVNSARPWAAAALPAACQTGRRRGGWAHGHSSAQNGPVSPLSHGNVGGERPRSARLF